MAQVVTQYIANLDETRPQDSIGVYVNRKDCEEINRLLSEMDASDAQT
jgi:hypothetical protein